MNPDTASENLSWVPKQDERDWSNVPENTLFPEAGRDNGIAGVAEKLTDGFTGITVDVRNVGGSIYDISVLETYIIELRGGKIISNWEDFTFEIIQSIGYLVIGSYLLGELDLLLCTIIFQLYETCIRDVSTSHKLEN